MILSACRESNTKTKQGEPPVQTTEAPRLDKSVSLTITGFNYTDLYIDSFSVNGQGGGNIFVSSPTSGGGGSVCCVSFWPSSTLPLHVTVRWTRDLKRWCEKDVLVTGPVPASPEYLAVHFYPDGRIEAQITEGYPQVKLKLDRVNRSMRKASGNTVADERSARCQDGDY